MIKSPRISAALRKDYPGHVVISLNGKVIGIGKNSLKALESAKKKVPSIEEKEFLISRIHDEILVASISLCER